MDKKKKYVNPQVERYEINTTCLLMTSGSEREKSNTNVAPIWKGELG